MVNAAERFAEHALATDWERLSPVTQSAALTFLHDSLAVGIAGRNAPLADALAETVMRWTGFGGSSFVLGRPGLRVPAPYAAFINAFQIHAQEYDCVHEPAVAHPMATVCAALLAEAGRSTPCSGADFLAAMVAGVDIVACLGMAPKGRLKFFRPATAGIFGTTAALARLRRFDRQTTVDALGYALAFASGTMQAHIEGKPTLAVQVAAAARSAIEAADLAQAGFSGPAGSIDGPFGYLSLFEDDVALEPLLESLGALRRIEEVSWKPFPTGRAAHGAIVALQRMMAEQGLTADKLDQFTYRAPPLIERLVGRRPIRSMAVPYARLCFAWLGAIVLTRGTVVLDDFTPERLGDPDLSALAERIVVAADDNLDAAAFVPAVATATLKDGSVLRVDIDRQFGSPEWPLSREQHLAKARACLAFGGAEGVEAALSACIDHFATLTDVAAALTAVLEGNAAAAL
ncbi:MmgE/PrpD family protein [Sphingomonas hengshuiensis]|uniref:2-methylcitrate dehydratase n=1 Tax=Sphingomonas hengshuiensis TaxID=1609977 RepID=A0A7U5BF14_9SPHN|nr:MmgE/PrpD family protein [Sphingomonas hengshuiensis]AJP74061.1 2-methylcitrate dehydratase [Sphingomonas hengshuiensis]